MDIQGIVVVTGAGKALISHGDLEHDTKMEQEAALAEQ